MLLKLSSFTVAKAYLYGYQFLLFFCRCLFTSVVALSKMFVLVCFTRNTCTQGLGFNVPQFGLNVCTLQCLVAVLEKFFIDYNFFHRLGEENRRVLASAVPLLLCHLQRLVLELLSLESQLAAKRNILELHWDFLSFVMNCYINKLSIKGTVQPDQICMCFKLGYALKISLFPFFIVFIEFYEYFTRLRKKVQNQSEHGFTSKLNNMSNPFFILAAQFESAYGLELVIIPMFEF